MDIEFCRANLISGSETLFKRIPQNARTVFAISDIFTGQNELTYGSTAINKFYDRFFQRAADFPNLVISGKDLEGMPFVTQPFLRKTACS